MVGAADLEVYQGDDYAATVTVANVTGTTPDLTGYTAHAQIRLTPADHSPKLIEMVTHVSPPNTILLSIPNAQTVTLIYAHYVWDLQVTAPDGTITTLLAGYVDVTQEVTREP
jgi:hypothetical protein